MAPKISSDRPAMHRTSSWAGFALFIFSIAHAQMPDTDAQIIQLRVSAGKVIGAMMTDNGVIRVSRGENIELRWSTDEPLDIHLHGYDIEKTLTPGTDVNMSFNAYATGRFPITVHGAHGAESHAKSEQTLIYLEVYPE